MHQRDFLLSVKYNKPKDINLTSEKVCFGEQFSKHSEETVLDVIGEVNLQKWNDIKIQLSCKTNTEFVTRLLDIAEEFLHRISSTSNTSAPPAKKRSLKTQISKNKQNSSIGLINSETQLSVNNKNDETGQSYSAKISNVIPSKTNIANATAIVQDIVIFNDIDDIDKRQTSGTLDSSQEQSEITGATLDIAPVRENLDKIKIKICQNCNTHHLEGTCPIEYPHYVITDALDRNEWLKKYKSAYEKQFRDGNEDNRTDIINNEINKLAYSVLSLPECLSVSIEQDQLRVFAKTDFEPFTQFGPLVGKVVKEKDIPEDVEMKYIWEVFDSNGNIYFNTESASLSNWAKYIRPAPDKEDKNISVISRDKKLYFVSVKFIKSGEELLYWQFSPFMAGKKKMEKSACGGCNIEFNHPLYYRIHCSLFHDIRYSLTIKKYHCKVCGLAVLGKENIMKHAAEQHNGQGAYQCQFCKKFFLRLNYLEMHRTYGCSANPHRSVPLCDFCGKKFCQPQKLKVHIKRMHSDPSEVIKEFQCKDCKKILGSRPALQRHSKEVHQKHTDGQCSKCGKKFQNKSNLKIHMLTHSGIKPFKCMVANCRAAFTTKQCLQFHYKKSHNYAEDNMPKIERSIDYTFQAYSGSMNRDKENEGSKQDTNRIEEEKESESENESISNQNPDDPPVQPDEEHNKEEERNVLQEKEAPSVGNMKVLTKGSKKWISDESSSNVKLPDIYSVERLTKETFPSVSLADSDICSRNKLTNISEFNRHDASNASLLVEAALNSVCNEPELDIDVSTSPNCPDSLVNNLYSLAQSDNLPDVSFNEAACINDSRHMTLISPSMTDHVSVTDDLKDDLKDDRININYPGFAQGDFSPPNSPDEHRANFVRNYINSLSPNPSYSEKNSAVPSPPRFDLGPGISTDRLSCDDDVISVQNLSVQNLSLHPKNIIHMDLPSYKLSYKISSQDFRRIKFDNVMDQEHLPSSMQASDLSKDLDSHCHSKYSEDLTTDIRHKFDVDLDIRLRNYESIDDVIRQKSHTYENSELDFRNKTYDLMDSSDSRNKQYDIETDFRTDRNFEPLILNSSELQGLDMSARSFHNYPNFNRYHHLYPELDRVDLRLNYSPPPSSYTHADILRVSSLDLTSPGRHSVDLSLRNHPLHQITNTRLLTEHALPSNNHRILDQNCLISTDLSSNRHLTTDRIIPDASTRILTDHTTPRFLNDPITTNHLINSDQRLISDDPRLLSEQSRLLDQRGLISETRLQSSSTRSGSTSPVQGFSGYNMSQNPYHPTSLTTRSHVTSPTSTLYPYAPYY